MIKKVIYLCCLLLLVSNVKAAWSWDEVEAGILAMPYPKSYDIKTYQDEANGISNVIFKVHLTFPSKDVLEFYNAKLKDIGWAPFVEDYYRYADRVWQDFLDGTVEGDPLVHQLIAYWTNQDKSRRAILAIIYHSRYSTIQEKMSAKEPNNDIQEVAVQFMPFYILPPPSAGK